MDLGGDPSGVEGLGEPIAPSIFMKKFDDPSTHSDQIMMSESPSEKESRLHRSQI